MKQRETSFQLQIKNLKVEDSGQYSCECGGQKTTADVKVTGTDLLILKEEVQQSQFNHLSLILSYSGVAWQK